MTLRVLTIESVQAYAWLFSVALSETMKRRIFLERFTISLRSIEEAGYERAYTGVGVFDVGWGCA